MKGTLTHSSPPIVRTMLAPIASLRLTVMLLVMSMLVIFTGTAAQKELPLYEVLNRFFYSWIAWIPVKYLFPLWPRPWGAANGDGAWNGRFPFIGGYSLMALLLVNLLAAHAMRFKMSWKRAGIFLIHFSLILLLVGEFLSSALKIENHLTFLEGEKRSWVEDNRETELAIVDHSPANHDNVVVIPASRLHDGAVLKSAKLPFEVKVDRWYPNAHIVGPMEEASQSADHLATAGAMQSVGLLKLPPVTGIEGSSIDAPAAFLTLSADGKSLGTYAAGLQLKQVEVVEVNGKKYDLDLRLKRSYLPFSFTLSKFSHDQYQGVAVASNFASHVRLSDPANGVDRDVVIKMNSPLRYGGRTIYQSGFNPEVPNLTTLQVVHNPAWIMPYLACILGAIGLVVHFGTVLVGFLGKRAAAGELVGFGAAPPSRTMEGDRASRRRQARDAARSGQSSYTIPAKFGGFAAILPGALAVVAVVSVLGWAFTCTSTPGAFDLQTFGKLPVMFGGRVMPLDTLARTSLKVINGMEAVKTSERTVPPIEWLADVLSGKPAADKYRVFLIDSPQIREMLSLTPEQLKDSKDPNQRRFTFEEILLTHPESGGKLEEQVDALKGLSDKQYDLYQRQIADLHQRLVLQMQLSQAGSLQILSDIWSSSDSGKKFVSAMETAAQTDPSQRSVDQDQILMQSNRLTMQIKRLQLLQQSKDTRKEDLLFVPPAEDGGDWRGMGMSLIDARTRTTGDVTVGPELGSLFKILGDYRDGKAANFNADVKAYADSVSQQFPATLSKSSFESFFNHFDVFDISIFLYVVAFLLVATSWLGWTRPLWRSSLAMLVIAFVVHTAGLIMRLDISGRPPVTNLYSSAVFIAWGVVLMAMGLEWVFRNGLGIATSAAVGTVSLFIADGLAIVDGDTMKPLQAVLDTNFWLATHVVCITLGYAATFLAGSLAIAYIVGGVFTRAFENQDLRKSLARMNYGILCFAIIFSFVGTILGGIWADQSWGRFWGWDPKENGAILIVLWNAVILHARWGGIVREKGVMTLGVLGNIVTAWSWFGTNMMGVGLHSYGFMESGVFWLSVAVMVHLVIAAVSMLPKSMWLSFGTERPPLLAR